MEILLTDVLFYRNGVSGATRIVGNETGDSTGRRIARYTFITPAAGAGKEIMVFHISGLSDGSRIPVRFFIGTDPDSHANAGPESEYTGELTLAGDWLSFSGETTKLLLPGKTYYLWVFPGEDKFGYYSWGRTGYTSALDLSGAACVVPVVKNGSIENRVVTVVKEGKLYLAMPVVVKNGQAWIAGPGGGAV